MDTTSITIRRTKTGHIFKADQRAIDQALAAFEDGHRKANVEDFLTGRLSHILHLAHLAGVDVISARVYPVHGWVANSRKWVHHTQVYLHLRRYANGDIVVDIRTTDPRCSYRNHAESSLNNRNTEQVLEAARKARKAS